MPSATKTSLLNSTFDHSMLVRLCEMDEVSCHFICANDFHVKARNEIFTAVGSRCRQNLRFEILADYVKEMCLNPCLTCNTINSPRFINYIIDLSRRCSRGLFKFPYMHAQI